MSRLSLKGMLLKGMSAASLALLAYLACANVITLGGPRDFTVTQVDPDPGGGGLDEDAYSGYTTFHLDLSNGSDSDNGLTEETAKRTWSAATALLTSPGSRLLVKGSGTLTQNVTLPAGGTSDDARIVVMGYPDEPMPVVTVGSFTFQASASGARNFVTIRKIRFTGGNNTSAIEVGRFNSMTDFIGEYIQCDGMGGSNDDNRACIYLVEDSADRAIIRYSKLGEVHTGGVGFHNGPTILSYQNDDVQIYNNDLYDAQILIRWKEPPTNGHGPKILRNILRSSTEFAIGLHNDNQVVDGHGFGGSEISGNLFYDYEAGIVVFDNFNDVDGFDVWNNTFAEDGNFSAITFEGMSSIDIRNNVSAGPVAHVRSYYYQNDGDPPIRFSHIDHNFYIASGGEWVLGENLAGSVTYTSFPPTDGWQRAKTLDNHADLSELDAANPDLNGGTFSSLADTFVDHSTRDYTLEDTSPLKGAADGGGDPGYDPNNIGPGW